MRYVILEPELDTLQDQERGALCPYDLCADFDKACPPSILLGGTFLYFDLAEKTYHFWFILFTSALFRWRRDEKALVSMRQLN